MTPILLMLGSGSDPREAEYVHALQAADVRVTRFPLRRHVDPGLVVRLWRWFGRQRPDVVHTHLVHADVQAGLAARLARAPLLVSTKHNDDRFRLRWPVRGIERALAARTDHTVTISDALRSFHLALTGADPTRVTTIRYGYAPPDPTGDPATVRAELGLPADAPLVLAVGRLVDQKGHDVLLRALPQVTTTPPPWLVIAGEGNRRATLLRLATELGIADRVLLIGERDDVGRLMRAATVLAHPARWEGFGLVLLEAMAARLPVVAAAVSAIPEVIAADRSGLLVPPDDVPALAGALTRLLDDLPLREQLAANGHERLRTHFSADRMARQHEDLYEALTKRRHVE